MATNYNPNPSGTSNTTGWAATAGSISSTADGLRWTKTAGSASGVLEIDISVAGNPPSGVQYTLCQMSIRKNSLTGIQPYTVRLLVWDDVTEAYIAADKSIGNIIYPSASQWIQLPNTPNTGTLKPNSTLKVGLYASAGAMDITIRTVNVYKTSDVTAEGITGAVIDSGESSFTATIPNNSTVCTFVHGTPNEAVNDLIWNWGDGSANTLGTNRAPSHTFPTAGTYLVQLTATNVWGQSHTSQQNLVVPSGTFDAAYTYTTGAGTLDVNGSSSVATAGIGTYTWSWGDGTSDTTGQTQSHTYAAGGTYSVALTITNSLGQSNTETKSIVVAAPPNPNLFFTESIDLLVAQFFPSVTTGGTTYAWTFGDSGSSTAQNPTHTYAAAGTYTVTLTINGSLAVSRSVSVSDTYARLKPGSVLALEVAQNPGEGTIWNRLPNPNGEQGAFGWSTPVSGSLVASSNTSTGTNDHGFSGWKLWYSSSGTGAQTFYSAPVAVSAGQYVSAAWTVPYTEGYHRLTVDALDASGAVLGSSGTTGYLQAGSNQRTTAYLLPASTKYARLKVQFTSNTSTGVPVAGKIVMFRRAIIATAGSSGALTTLTYVEGLEWEDVLGPTHEIQVEREPLDISTLSAEILDAELDPAVSATIRPGAKVRLRVSTKDDQGNAVWENLYAGTLDSADVKYERTAVVDKEVPYPLLTNTILNPSREGTTDTGYVTGTNSSRVTTWSSLGTYSTKITTSAVASTDRYYWPKGTGTSFQTVAVATGDKVSAQVTIKAIVAFNVYFSLAQSSGGLLQGVTVQFAAGEEKTVELRDVNVTGPHPWADLSLRFFTAGTTTNYPTASTDLCYLDQFVVYNAGSRALGLPSVVYFDGETGGTWTGTAHASSSVYQLDGVWYLQPTAADRKKVRIALTAVDALTALANVSEPRGVGSVADLPMLLEGRSVPYLVNGSAGQVPVATVVSNNDQASLLDQLAIARDVDSGYVHVSRNGVLVANDPAHVSATEKAELDETVYNDVDATFSTKELINSVLVKWLRYTASTGETKEIQYGPYEDSASIEQWGLAAQEFVLQGTTENPSAIATKAAAILTANSTPGRRVNSVMLTIRYAKDIHLALLDLMDLVRVQHAATSTDQAVRITGVTHTITPDRWMVQLGFNSDGSVARPVATPSPALQGDVLNLVLGTADLDTYTTPGVYSQGTSANATLARHYPVTWAGVLEVLTTQTANIMIQRYTAYRNDIRTGTPVVYTRVWSSTPLWSPWEPLVDDSGWVTTIGSICVAQTGWSVASGFVRKVGKTVYFRVVGNRTGAAVTVTTTSGGTTTSPMFQMVAAYRPGGSAPLQGIMGGTNTRNVGGRIDDDGIFTIANITGTASIATNDQIVVAGTYLLS